MRRDAVLEVGALTETVTVEAEATVLATDRAALSQTIDERAVSELPVAGRNVWALAGTTPGVLAGSTSDIGFSFRGAGQRNIQNNMTLDGISSSANLLAMTSMRPIQDAVEEVQVQTGSTSAEYGSFLGVHVNVVTKSGTNQFHGSAYEYYQSDALNARGYFENRAVPANPLRRDQYGAAVRRPGGDSRPLRRAQPDVLHGRVRGHPRGGRRARSSRCPPRRCAAETSPRSRRRSGTRTPGCRSRATTSRSRCSIPSRWHLLKYYPLPNLPGTASNFQGPAQDGDDHDQVIVRVDQNISNNIRLSFRYNWMDSAEVLSPSPIEIQRITQPRVNKNWLAPTRTR